MMAHMGRALWVWFEETAGARSWPAAERKRIVGCLQRICRANYGMIHADIDLNDEIRDWYWSLVTDEAITKILRLYAASIPRNVSRHWLRPAGSEVPTSMFEAVTYDACVDINRADAGTLATLPGIGQVLARRIVDYRLERGPFAVPDDLMQVSGIGQGTIDAVRAAVYNGDPDRPPVFSAPILDRFGRDPSLPCYISLIRHTGGRFIEGRGVPGELPLDDDAVADRVASELELIADAVERDRFTGFGRAGLVPASRVRLLWDRQQRAVMQPFDAAGASVVSNTRYLRFIMSLIERAETRVRVAVFYMSLDPVSPSGTRLLADALVAAWNRGIDVRVLIDWDTPDSEYGAGVINRAAFEYLTGHGLPVARVQTGGKLHIKCVVVDDQHVVIGSHNWTAGSLFRYDDKSMYVASTPLAARVCERLDEVWIDSLRSVREEV